MPTKTGRIWMLGQAFSIAIDWLGVISILMNVRKITRQA